MTRRRARLRKARAELAQIRRRAYRVLEEAPRDDLLSVVVNRLLVALIALNLVTVVLASVPSLDAAYHAEFALVEIVSLVVFSVEYFLRIWIAADRPQPRRRRQRRMPPWLAYVVSLPGLIDLLAVLPFWLGLVLTADFRVLLVFRIVRFFKVARYSPAMRSLLDALYAERRALVGCIIILLGATVVAATVMHVVEGPAQPDVFGTIPDAMWWAVVTLTTTGYGDAVPITPLGKVVGGLATLMGIVMLALPVGIVATAFANEIHRRDFVVTWGMVSRVPLFAGLAAGDIADIARLLSAHTVEAGETIVRRGDTAHSMYFVSAGEVEIELPTDSVRLGVGQFFGEIAVLRRARRSANVTAVTRTHLLVLEGADLHALMERDPRLAERVNAVADNRAAQNAVSPRGDIAESELAEKRD